MKFPSEEWCRAAAKAMLADPAVIAAIRDFGAVVAGIVIERGAGLKSDFCALVRVASAEAVHLEFPEDEDELESLEPDYICWISYELCRSLLEETFAGGRPDPLQAVLQRKVRLKGDLERLVRHAGRHRGAGRDALRTIPTEFV